MSEPQLSPEWDSAYVQEYKVRIIHFDLFTRDGLTVKHRGAGLCHYCRCVVIDDFTRALTDGTK